MSHPGKKLPAAGLASCIIGLIVSPYIYIAIGALSDFQMAFSLVTLPPLLLGSGFLFWRFLSKPVQAQTSTTLLALEGISWLTIGLFLVLISGFNLLTTFERIGLFCTFLLLASVLSLPLLLMRDTALEQRLKKLPSTVSMAALLLIVVLSGLAMGAYLLRAPAFI